MLRYLTAGESHGPCLIGILEHFPAGVPVNKSEIDRQLWRRQQGYGRGGRMQIEADQVEILTGVRGGKTLGSPITLKVENKDYQNWQPFMNAEDVNEKEKRVTQVRPGHADLSGVIKYGFDDARNVLERSSARETAARVALGAVARQLLSCFDIHIYSHVVAIGSVQSQSEDPAEKAFEQAEVSPVRCISKEDGNRMMAEIDSAKEKGDSLGGVFEICVYGLPVGLGDYTQWDRKLDGILAQHLMSIQAIKGVEIGLGFEAAVLPGSKVQDEIFWDENKGYYRKTNRAGGIEGGMTNGEVLRVRCAMKPIPTLMRPLQTVDIDAHEACEASVERSDCCAVPAASVVGEAMTALALCGTLIEKLGGDSLEEMKKRWNALSCK